MKTRIIRLAIGLTALVASFLPQQAEALCIAVCWGGVCWGDIYGCKNNKPVCIDA